MKHTLRHSAPKARQKFSCCDQMLAARVCIYTGFGFNGVMGSTPEFLSGAIGDGPSFDLKWSPINARLWGRDAHLGYFELKMLKPTSPPATFGWSKSNRPNPP
jgi:hypothetical protein